MPGKPYIPNQASIAARGHAAAARETGVVNGVEGFERGGPHRQAANHIVHAEPGHARDHKKEAADLFKRAAKK